MFMEYKAKLLVTPKMERGNSNFAHGVKNVSSLFSATESLSGSACAESTDWTM